MKNVFSIATKTTKNISSAKSGLGAKAPTPCFCGPTPYTYGENYFEMKSTWQTPYKFNGKEKDEETGLYYYGARYYSPELSIWGSVDPMADSRSWVSPYSYCQNNPVMRVDPMGALDILVITGEEADAATNQLQEGVPNLKLTRDEDGRIHASGNAVTDYEKKLLNVIEDPNITVNIDAINTDEIEYNGIFYGFRGGAFMGNTVSNNSTTAKFNTPFGVTEFTFNYNTVNAYQTVNPEMLLDFDYYGTKGQSMLHEATEAYSGALISQKTGISASPAITTKNNTICWIYNQAHKAKTTVPQPLDGKISTNDLIRARFLRLP